MTTSTNYYDTFIAVADDCPISAAEVPQQKGDLRSVAGMQFEMIAGHPYEFTSDDVLFEVFAERKGIEPANKAAERQRFFSKGQPCLRSSALGKRYGWGIHSDAAGRVAVVALGSEEYGRLAGNAELAQLKAMRSKRA